MHPSLAAIKYNPVPHNWTVYSSLLFRKLKVSLSLPKYWRLQLIRALLLAGLLSFIMLFPRGNNNFINLNVIPGGAFSNFESQMQWVGKRLLWTNAYNESLSSVSMSVSSNDKRQGNETTPTGEKPDEKQNNVHHASSGSASLSKLGDSNGESVQSTNGTIADVNETSTILLGKGEALCPLVPPNLVGVLKINRTAPPLEEQERLHPELEQGGRFRPAECQARHRVAIIVPFRNREDQLPPFLNHIHPFLQRQQIDYGVYIVEQAGNDTFNKGMIMNIGALESLKLYQYDCFIFHDVDLLPENDRNLYTCPDQPRHLGVLVDTLNYQLIYGSMFGGVVAMTVDQFKKVNGFSNEYLGWGGEDDDMSNRVRFHGFHITRYPFNITRYTMLSHKKAKANPVRLKKLYSGNQRFKTDGLNSIKYKSVDVQLRRLYTYIYIDLYHS